MRAVVLTLAFSGCLSVPDEAPVECKSNADCDTANGEICAENVCYGNPPPGPFAALITPPTERKTELVSHELELGSFPADGQFGDLMLAEPVTYSGQVVCPSQCGNEMLGAEITVTRPSSFAGGPAFRQVFNTDARTGNFQLIVPRGGPEYSITVVPVGRDENAAVNSMASLVPPLRTTLSLDSNMQAKTLDLDGAAPSVVISGEIVDVLGVPQKNYRIVALGRWDATSPLSEVSTVDFIRAGGGNSFSIRLSDGLQGKIEIVAQPFDQPLHPTLRLPNVTPVATSQLQLVVPSLGTEVPLTIIVDGKNTGGDVAKVEGAHVTVRGKIDDGTTTPATFIREGDTDATGRVMFAVPSGDFQGRYSVSVVPPGNATVGMVFQQPIDPGATFATLKLPDRVALVGKVVDIAGNPLSGVQVTAVPSLRFQWSLINAQSFITSIPSANAVTLDTGEFVLFVDPVVNNDDDGDLDVFGYYDLVFSPTETSNAPSWTVFEVEMPRDGSDVTMAPTVLPDAAHIRGRILDPFGEVVEDAELKLFRIEDSSAFAVFCQGLANAPLNCPIPAFLLGRGVTDVDGVARLTLPR